MTVKGEFADYDGTLDLSAEPAVELTLQAASLNTKMAKRDEHLRSGDFFDVEQHPQIRFSSDSATIDGDTVSVRGQLHAAGRQIPLELDATVRELDGELEIEAVTEADHRELGMTWSPLGILRAPSKLIVRGRLVRRKGNQTMRAITLDSADTPPALREDLPEPTPTDNEVLVRVHASSVNPVDNSIAAGLLAQMGVQYEYPVILGRDYAGVIEQVGSAVSDYKPGDQVFGFLLHANPTARAGAWAELITVTEELSIAPVPDGVDLAVAGAAPLAGITALAAVDALDLSEGDVLLVAGATGGVGSLAVQLAARAGARILAPALPEDEQFLRELGVSDVLARDGDIAEIVRERCPTASTRCWTSSTTRPAATTRRSSPTRASPHPPAPPARDPAAPT